MPMPNKITPTSYRFIGWILRIPDYPLIAQGWFRVRDCLPVKGIRVEVLYDGYNPEYTYKGFAIILIPGLKPSAEETVWLSSTQKANITHWRPICLPK